jgi:hypothetical protein
MGDPAALSAFIQKNGLPAPFREPPRKRKNQADIFGLLLT